jgi:hypothetical protein
MTDELQGWVNTAVKEALPSAGTFTLAEVAEGVLARLRKENPRRFNEWLRANATVLLADQIRKMLGAERSHARKAAERGVFAEYANSQARALQAGGALPVRPEELLWNQRQAVNDKDEWKFEHEMTKEDVLFVAKGHDVRRKQAAMQQAFYEAVARKLRPGKMVADVFTPESYFNIRESLASPAPAA